MDQDSKLITEAFYKKLNEDIVSDDQKILAAGWTREPQASGTSAHIPPYKKNGKFLFRDWIRNTWIVQQAPGFGAAWHSFDTLEDALASEADDEEGYAIQPGTGGLKVKRGSIL